MPPLKTFPNGKCKDDSPLEETPQDNKSSKLEEISFCTDSSFELASESGTTPASWSRLLSLKNLVNSPKTKIELEEDIVTSIKRNFSAPRIMKAR